MPLHYYHQVWLVLIFGWISNYMVRVALSPVLLPLMKEFSLSYSQAGLLASAVFYSYALMQFPAGYLGDRFGKKRILILCILGWGLSSLAMAAAASFAALLLVRFLTGLAQGTYFSNDRPIIAYYTPKEKAGIGQGISFMGLGLGMCLGILLAGWISDHWGWRAVFLIFSLPSLAAAFLIYRVIREPPREAIVSGKPRRAAPFLDLQTPGPVAPLPGRHPGRLCPVDDRGLGPGHAQGDRRPDRDRRLPLRQPLGPVRRPGSGSDRLAQ